MSSYAMVPGVSEEAMARAMNPASAHSPEPEIEVHDGVAKRPNPRRHRKTEDSEEG